MNEGKVVPIDDRVPKLKQKKRQKANRMLVGYIITFFLLILGIVYFQSPLSKVAHIEIKGNVHVNQDEVIKLSGLTNRTSLWQLGVSKTIEKLEKHKEIKTAKITRKFPNTVVIAIQENKRIGYLFNQSRVAPILDNGTLLNEVAASQMTGDAPVFLNWEKGEALQKMASELNKTPGAVMNVISEIRFDPTPSDPMHIKVLMNERFEVSASIKNFAKKIKAYPSIVSQLPDDATGVINLDVGYYFRPYDNIKAKDEAKHASER